MQSWLNFIAGFVIANLKPPSSMQISLDEATTWTLASDFFHHGLNNVCFFMFGSRCNVKWGTALNN
jgi:hypothetical protein